MLVESWIDLMFVELAGMDYLSWYDLDQRESSHNLFDFGLELSQCDSNLYPAQFFNPKIICALSIFLSFVS